MSIRWMQLVTIGAYFFFHPSVLYILATNWGCYLPTDSVSQHACCAVVPANDMQMGITYNVGCKRSTDLCPEPIPPGEYHGRCGISGTNYILKVEGEAPEEDVYECTIQVSQLLIVPKNNNMCDNSIFGNSLCTNMSTVPHGRVKFNIQPDSDSLFCFILHKPGTSEATIFYLPPDEQHDYTSASDILHHLLHQEQEQQLSIESILKLGGELDMGKVTLVFTDVVSSTDMYRRLGDWKALELVKAHFQILFQAFSTWGRVVKTVDDAVMTSFASPTAAMRASAEALLEIQIKIGIHAGPALVVPVNGITVNRAVRLEGQAPPGGCLVSAEAIEEEVLEDILSEEEFAKVEPQSFCLKGIGETTQAFGFQLKTARESIRN